jgi:hypothetical protein
MKIFVESLDDLVLLEQMDEAAALAEEDDSVDAFAARYAPDEELGCGEKELQHDRHRWELDPASSEDYIERARPGGLSTRWRHF